MSNSYKLSTVTSTGKVTSPQLTSRSNSADRVSEKLNHIPRSLCRRLSPKRQAPSIRNRVPSPPPKLSDQLISVPWPELPSSRTFVSDSRMNEPSVAVKVSSSRLGAPDIASISMPCSSAEAPVASNVRKSAGRQGRIRPHPTMRGEIFEELMGFAVIGILSARVAVFRCYRERRWRPNPHRPSDSRSTALLDGGFDRVGGRPAVA